MPGRWYKWGSDPDDVSIIEEDGTPDGRLVAQHLKLADADLIMRALAVIQKLDGWKVSPPMPSRLSDEEVQMLYTQERGR